MWYSNSNGFFSSYLVVIPLIRLAIYVLHIDTSTTSKISAKYLEKYFAVGKLEIVAALKDRMALIDFQSINPNVELKFCTNKHASAYQ